mmetsp:Transcript_55923/g.149697  ORF Transcript_55923/g.149697 Transcript_55923/m.149697 type:complete len:214 (+) Transcript_55923:84-725(+)
MPPPLRPAPRPRAASASLSTSLPPASPAGGAPSPSPSPRAASRGLFSWWSSPPAAAADLSRSTKPGSSPFAAKAPGNSNNGEGFNALAARLLNLSVLLARRAVRHSSCSAVSYCLSNCLSAGSVCNPSFTMFRSTPSLCSSKPATWPTLAKSCPSRATRLPPLVTVEVPRMRRSRADEAEAAALSIGPGSLRPGEAWGKGLALLLTHSHLSPC